MLIHSKSTQRASSPFKLRFHKTALQEWAERYGKYYDDVGVQRIGEAAPKEGFLTRAQLLEIAYFEQIKHASRKSSRNAVRVWPASLMM